MPKEILHWSVAQATAQALAGTAFAPALARRPECLLLGAVLHDALFYLAGRGPEAVVRLPHIWHGAHGEDSFALLRAQAELVRSNPAAPGPAALFVGLATHIFADAAIHPLVYACTGNYYHPDEAERTKAVRRHRALETIMDLTLAGGLPKVRGYSLRALVNALREPLDALLAVDALAAAFHLDPKALLHGLTQSLDTFATMQSLATTEIVASLAFSLSPLLPAKLKEIAALFYAPQFTPHMPRLAGPLIYRHPVTGETLIATLQSLVETATRTSAAFCRALEPYLLGRAPAPAELQTYGPSLDTGLPSMGVSALRSFNADFFCNPLGL